MPGKLEIHHPRDTAVQGIVCAIPTFGMVHADFAQSLANQATPINFGMPVFFIGHTPPFRNVRWDPELKKTLPYLEYKKRYPMDDRDPWIHDVGEARNIAAEFTINNKFAYLFFRDDDTVAPPDAVNKLFSDRLDIVSGLYCSKQEPPHSLNLVRGYLAGYEDFRPGEILKVTHSGMGCTLIRAEVLQAIEEKCGRPWFKTVKTMADNDLGELAPGTGMMTEDVYFCTKAKACGYQTYVDTGVVCQHVDVKTNKKYYYNSALRSNVWEHYDGQVNWYPRGEHVARASTPKMIAGIKENQASLPNPPEKPTCPKPLRFNLGEPGEAKNTTGTLLGYLNVDLYEKADIQGNVEDLHGLVIQYDFPDELRASHVLEHFYPGSVVPILKNWFHHLRPGGRLLVSIPDFQWASERGLACKDADPDEWFINLAMVYGAQRNPGDLHRTCFGMTQIVKLLKFCGFEIEDAWFEQYVDPRVQRSCTVSAKKPIYDDDELLPAEGLLDLDVIKRERADDVEAAARIYDRDEPPQPMMHAYTQKKETTDGTDDAGESGSVRGSDSEGASGDGVGSGAEVEGASRAA